MILLFSSVLKWRCFELTLIHVIDNQIFNMIVCYAYLLAVRLACVCGSCVCVCVHAPVIFLYFHFLVILIHLNSLNETTIEKWQKNTKIKEIYLLQYYNGASRITTIMLLQKEKKIACEYKEANCLTPCICYCTCVIFMAFYNVLIIIRYVYNCAFPFVVLFVF